MMETIQIKCENLMTLIASNLYIHSIKNQKKLRFTRLEIPNFLADYVDYAVNSAVKERENKVHSNKVYLYRDPFKMCYLTWPLRTKEGICCTVTLGPLIKEQLTSEEIKYIGYRMKLSSQNCFILESFYQTVPYFDKIEIIRLSSLVLDYLSAESYLPQIIREDHSLNRLEDKIKIEDKFKTKSYVSENYAIESKVLKAVEEGDVDYINNADNILKYSNRQVFIPPRFPGNPLRESKNMSITLNSISLRAALKGGLNEEVAHSISHNFAIKIEKQTLAKGANDLNIEILRKYAESVQKYALKGYSPLVVSAVNFIRTHMVEKVLLLDIADHLHISSGHLGKVFKKEMGITISDYIHKTKIEESCNLLTSRAYSISQIAYTFGYSSPAHYTKAFKKQMGYSPRQWQKQYSQ